MKTTDDLLGFLYSVVQENTAQYQSDFSYDVEKLRAAASKDSPVDRTLYWMSRPSGTWCFAERDVLLRDSEAYAIWTYYWDDPDGIRAFRVHITGVDEQTGKLAGNIQPFHYIQQVERVKRIALPIHHATGIYQDGTPFVVPEGRFSLNELMEHGGIKEKRYEPENELELENRIRQEHRAQDKSKKQNKRHSQVR